MAKYNKILQEYWYTDISSSYTYISQSQGTDDQVIDIAAIFIGLVMRRSYHMEQVHVIKHLTICLALQARCGWRSCFMVIQNESKVNLEFINMSSWVFAMTYDGMGTMIPNLCYWKNS